MELILRLQLKPLWHNIRVTRRYITKLLEELNVDINKIQKIEVASAELMENACKNSKIDWIIIELEKNNSSLNIKVKNVTEEKNIKEFEKIFSLINNNNPFETYKKMMIRKSKIHDPKISQLGLARIRYECNADINYKILKNDFSFTIPNIENNYMQLDVQAKIPLEFNGDKNVY